MKRVLDVAIRDMYGEALTVPASSGSPTSFAVRPGYTKVLVEPAAASRIQLAPKVKAAFFYDNSAAAGSKWIDLLGGNEALLDRGQSNATGTTLDSAQAADFIYLGFDFPVRGVEVDVVSANATASVLAATYSKDDDTFAGLTETDGTASGGASLAQDGQITWTVPTDWAKSDLRTVLSDDLAPGAQLYWVRLAFGGGLDADTELNTISALNETSGVGGYFKASTEYTFEIDDEVGALEVIAQAASPTTLNVTWIRR